MVTRHSLQRILSSCFIAHCALLSIAFAQTPISSLSLTDVAGETADQVLQKIPPGENFTFSPVSFSTATALFYSGANGQTAKQMRETFSFPEDASQLTRLFAEHYANAPSFSKPMLGVRCLNNDGYGLRVTEVFPGTPAEQEGINPKDLVLAVNGTVVRNEQEWAEQVGRAGDEVKLTRFDYESGKVVESVIRVTGQLQTTNALWMQQGLEVSPEFAKMIESAFLVDLQDLDFQRSSAMARQYINDWVRAETKDRVQTLLPRGAVSGLTRMVFTNTVTLDADWEMPFPTDELSISWLNGGHTTAVQGMGQRGDFAYLETADLQMLELPYAGNELSMLIILPAKGQDWASFRSQFSTASLTKLRTELVLTSLQVAVPKFSFSSRLSLKTLFEPQLQAAFSDNADFTGIVESDEIKLTDVLQEAFISVHNRGTEAGAASAGVAGIKSSRAKELMVNRPFIFMIVDRTSGLPWFVGQVFNPET